MIKNFFLHNFYIKVNKNRFELKNLSARGGWESIVPEQPFTTERLLVGQFAVAESTLKALIKRALPRGLIIKRPQVVIHPLIMVTGGLSEVEERIFRELAFGSGACKVALHVGKELSDSEAAALILRSI